MATAPQYTNAKRNFCLYKKEPSNVEERREGDDVDVIVSVVATDLDPDKETHLRRYVVQKASKNLLYKSGTVNAIPRGTPPSPTPKGTQPTQLVGFLALIELAGEHLDDATAIVDDAGDDTPVPPKRPSREYYICFLCEVDSDHSLGLFHTELKNFTDRLLPLLQKHANANASGEDVHDATTALTQSITLAASSWYWTCVEYITRCVNLLDVQLDAVLHAILLGKQIVLAAPQPVFDDLAKLLLVVSIVNLSPLAPRGGGGVGGEDEGEEPVAVQGAASGGGEDGSRLVISCTVTPLTTFATTTTSTTTTTTATAAANTTTLDHPSLSLDTANAEHESAPPSVPQPHPLSRNPSVAYIPRAGDYGDMQVTLNSKETNNFCTQWANQLRNGSSDPFRLRTLLEDLKLKVIQELNFIRKVIDLAKLSNYQLYKSYVVLRGNSNCDVLLNLLMKDITNDVTTTEVLEAIFEYIQEEASVEQPAR